MPQIQVCYIFIIIQFEIFPNFSGDGAFHMWIICVSFFFNFQIIVLSPIIVLSNPRLIPLWSEKIPFLMSVLLGLSGCVLSWRMFCIRLRGRLFPLLVVFYTRELHPTGWPCCSVLLKPCWSFGNIYFRKKIRGDSRWSWEHCAFELGTVHDRGATRGVYLVWDIVR